MGRIQIILSVAAVLVLHISPRVLAQNAATPGQITATATIQSIGIEWRISGDANQNASCGVRFRVSGAGAWTDALPLFRDYWHGMAGSILNLCPATTYDILLELTDPDGGVENRIITCATRAVPTQVNMRIFHVVPGSGGGNGSEGNPFRGIAAAETVAQPGDTFLLHAGNYGVVTLTKHGTSDNWIVWKAAGDGRPIVRGMFVADWTWIDGLAFIYDPAQPCLHNSAWASNGITTALTAPDGQTADYVCITNCSFHYYIYSIAGGEGWYIADNDITGAAPASNLYDIDFPFHHGFGAGILAFSSIVEYNCIVGAGQAVVAGGNTDVFSNYMQNEWTVYWRGCNTRICGNYIVNCRWTGSNNYTREPIYFIRNVRIGGDKSSYVGFDSVPFVTVNNTNIYSCYQLQWIDRQWEDWLDTTNNLNRNNLNITLSDTDSLRVIPAYSTVPYGSQGPFGFAPSDYDGYDWNAKDVSYLWDGNTYSSLQDWATHSGLEQHGMIVDRAEMFDNWDEFMQSLSYLFFTQPLDSFVLEHAPVNLALNPASIAVDAGIVLPDINEDYVGVAPDLGAIEVGKPLPHYGPRTKYTGLFILMVTNGSGSGGYNEGQHVDIIADSDPSIRVFDHWEGDTQYVANVNAPNTAVTMPAASIAVTAVYRLVHYTLTVNSGSGSGSYHVRQTIHISADAPAPGFAFLKWVGDTADVYVTEPDFTMTMPARDVTITAVYASGHNLTVINGSGSGCYVAGRIVRISADIPWGATFVKWTGDTANIVSIFSPSTFLTMPDFDITITGESRYLYTLNVGSGSGDGSYLAGTVVDIAADLPPSGQCFDRWMGDTAIVADVLSPNTTVIMPERNAGVTAHYKPIAYALTVTSGTGSGSFTAGTLVSIHANTPPTGKAFYRWIGSNGILLHDVYSPSQQFTMPACDVSFTATYDGSVYTLTVNSGSGSGQYMFNTLVPIVADAPQPGSVFYKWIGDTGTIANVNYPSTSMRIPALNAVVTAAYQVGHFTLTINSGSGSGSYTYNTVVPIAADPAPANYVFDRWTGDTASVADFLSPNTSIAMPSRSAALTATYAPVFALSVSGGAGSGNYRIGEKVHIVADPPSSGMVFDQWIGDTGTVEDIMKPHTIVMTVSAPMSIIAAYKISDLELESPAEAANVVERGSRFNITWSSPGVANKQQPVRIELVGSSGETWLLTDKAQAGKGSFVWNVGAWKSKTSQQVYPDGSNYRFRISIPGTSTVDNSTYFAIGTVTSLEILGPAEVAGNSSTQFTCVAHFNYGDTVDYTSKKLKWTVSTRSAKIFAGLLTARALSSDQPCNITAAYKTAGGTVVGSCQTVIKD